MKMKTNKIIAMCMVFCVMAVICCSTVNADAAIKVGKTGRIYCKLSDIYWKSAQKYCPNNIGDNNCYELEWKEVSKADGYKVVLAWDCEGEKVKETMIVKKKGNKYSSKIINESGNTSIYSSGKNCALGKGGFGTITTKKPYFILCTGTCVELKEVSIQAYRAVNGKKVYGKTVKKGM